MDKEHTKISPKIREFETSRDLSIVYDIWQEELASQWPISKEHLEHVLIHETEEGVGHRYRVAEVDGTPIAYLFSKFHTDQNRTNRDATITLVITRADYQRQGIARELITETLSFYKDQGIRKVRIGAGIGSYFWYGVPENLLDAVEFFQKAGWQYDSEDALDMIQDVTNYETPSSVYDRIKDQDIELSFLKPEDSQALLKFEKENFGDWYPYFKYRIDKEKWDEILIAKDAQGNILGSTLLNTNATYWNGLFDGQVSGGGALGVANSARGKGIGLALKARGTDILKQRGAKYIWISWTFEEDFYRKLGFEIWMRYKVGYIHLQK